MHETLRGTPGDAVKILCAAVLPVSAGWEDVQSEPFYPVINVKQKRFTCIFTSNKMAWIKFLNHSQFVGMKIQFFIKDSSHKTSRQPKSRCVFAGRPSGRSQNRLSHRFNVLG